MGEEYAERERVKKEEYDAYTHKPLHINTYIYKPMHLYAYIQGRIREKNQISRCMSAFKSILIPL